MTAQIIYFPVRKRPTTPLQMPAAQEISELLRGFVTEMDLYRQRRKKEGRVR